MKRFAFFLIFLVSCMPMPDGKPTPMEPNPFLAESLHCNTDGDCTCGGIDTQTNECFIGNRLYAAKFVDTSQVCPDFCSGIAGNLETRCVNNQCKSVPVMRGCPEDARVCPDGSTVVRGGPHCEFAPCPGEEVFCTQDVKECADGSFVPRMPPTCEFAPCPEDKLTACTMDAKICPDGTAVSRVGPDCEFAPCPGQ